MMAGLAGRKTARALGPAGRRFGGGGAWGTAADPASGASGGFTVARCNGSGARPWLLPAAAEVGLTVMRLRGVGSEAAEAESAGDSSRGRGKGGQSYRRGAYKVGGSSPPAPAPREYGPTSSASSSSSSPSSSFSPCTPPTSSSSRLCAPYASTSNLSAAAVAWDSMHRKSYGKGAFKENGSSARGAGDYIGRLSSPRPPSFSSPLPGPSQPLPPVSRPAYSPPPPPSLSYATGVSTQAAGAHYAAGAGTAGVNGSPPPAAAAGQPRKRARVPTPGISKRAATRSAGAAASKRSAKSSRPVTCAEWMARRSKAAPVVRSPSRPMSVAKWMNSRVKT